MSFYGQSVRFEIINKKGTAYFGLLILKDTRDTVDSAHTGDTLGTPDTLGLKSKTLQILRYQSAFSSAQLMRLTLVVVYLLRRALSFYPERVSRS